MAFCQGRDYGSFYCIFGLLHKQAAAVFPTIPKYAEMPAQAVPGREKTRREGV